MWLPLLSSQPLASSLKTSLLAYFNWCSASRKMKGKYETASGGEMRPAKLAPDKMMSTEPSVRPSVMSASLPRGEAGGGRGGVDAAGKARARQNDVDRAERQALVDVGFLAERGGREHLHLVAAVGAPFDLVAGPHRVFVKRFRYLVDMGPLELGLRSGDARHAEAGGGQR